jgi:hypothetical protein
VTGSALRLVLAERLASSLGVVNAIGWLEAVDLSQVGESSVRFFLAP